MGKTRRASRPRIVEQSHRSRNAWVLAAGAAAIVLLTLIAYAPAIRGGFIWDDDDYVTENLLLTAPDGLKRIWFSLDSPSQYFPLVYTTFRIEHAIWGLNPLGYHVVNVLLHVCNALLLWYLLSRLSIRGAWLAAAIFALHPVNVESVAWITERKNVLSTLFYLGTVLAWVRFTGSAERCWRYYAAALTFGALAHFAKTTACTLPAALLLVSWIGKDRVTWKRVVQVLPFVAMGLFMGLVSIWWEQNRQGTVGAEFALNPVQRILIASHALWFYLGKLVWPADLAFSYPKWDIDVHSASQYIWPAVCVVTAAVLWWKRKAVGRGPLAALVFFVAALMPMLGFFSLYTFRYTFVADHYQYLACIGPIALFASGMARRWPNRKAKTAMHYVVPAILLIVLGSLTWQQGHAYRNSETLWRDTIAKNPRSAMAYNNLARVMEKQGKRDKAFEYYAKAIELNPDMAEVQLNLGIALVEMGRPDEAIPHYRRALEISPDWADAHYDLGVALDKLNRYDEAAQEYQAALEIRPNYAEAHGNIGIDFIQLRRFDEAVIHFREAIRLKPDDPNHHNSLAAALFFTGDHAGAWREIRACEGLGGRPHPGLMQALSEKLPEPD